ncbi:LysR family transcriptional regulator, partial [Acinetobacter baumannii]|uniref:helix-turn-helix domain-containing protein n=1 Tax=Acinetobacter baumannii TaxID=470 RepID=UPI0038CDC93F
MGRKRGWRGAVAQRNAAARMPHNPRQRSARAMDRWQAMRVFCGVVDAQGFTAAQDRLGMTHSTASRHVKWLESELGTQLLQRNSRGLS